LNPSRLPFRHFGLSADYSEFYGNSQEFPGFGFSGKAVFALPQDVLQLTGDVPASVEMMQTLQRTTHTAILFAPVVRIVPNSWVRRSTRNKFFLDSFWFPVTISSVFPVSWPSLGERSMSQGLQSELISVPAAAAAAASPAAAAAPVNLPSSLDLSPLSGKEQESQLRRAVANMYHGQAVDWGNTDREEGANNKDQFMQWVVNAMGQSPTMRNLILEIGNDTTKPIYCYLAEDRKGQHLVDSFVMGNINMEDLKFFSERPHDALWEMTRGEQIIHVLAERRKFTEQSGKPMRSVPQNDRGSFFQACHQHACTAHNQFRRDLGQPPEEKDPTEKDVFDGEYVDGFEVEKLHTFSYGSGREIILKVGRNGRPLAKVFKGS
jgi:hypothetical protein